MAGPKEDSRSSNANVAHRRSRRAGIAGEVRYPIGIAIITDAHAFMAAPTRETERTRIASINALPVNAGIAHQIATLTKVRSIVGTDDRSIKDSHHEFARFRHRSDDADGMMEDPGESVLLQAPLRATPALNGRACASMFAFMNAARAWPAADDDAVALRQRLDEGDLYLQTIRRECDETLQRGVRELPGPAWLRDAAD